MPLFSPRRLALAIVLVLGVAGCAPEPIAVPVPTQVSTIAPPAPSTSLSSPQEATLTPSMTPMRGEAPRSPEVTSEPEGARSMTGPVTTATPSVEVLPAAILSSGDTGDEVRELQHRLLQLQWYEGKITENFGPQTQLALEGFQTKRGLPSLGFVDRATMDRLVGMSRTPTHDEMYNVLTPGPALLATGSTSRR